MAPDRGLKGATLHGIPGQGSEVYRLRRRLRVYGWGTAVLPRQTVQERTQTLQRLQGQAGVYVGSHPLGQLSQGGNADEFFGLWQGNHCTVQAQPRTASLLSGVLS